MAQIKIWMCFAVTKYVSNSLFDDNLTATSEKPIRWNQFSSGVLGNWTVHSCVDAQANMHAVSQPARKSDTPMLNYSPLPKKVSEVLSFRFHSGIALWNRKLQQDRPNSLNPTIQATTGFLQVTSKNTAGVWVGGSKVPLTRVDPLGGSSIPPGSSF